VSLTKSVTADSIVITAAGRLGAAAVSELTAALASAGNEGSRVALDLAGVDYISSAGLHVIVAAAKDLRSRNKTLTIRGAQGATKLSLDLAGSSLGAEYED
jgi:anti-anti-sigma factor